MSFAIIEGDVTLRSAGIELAVDDATALPANTRGFIGVGYDGTNTRFIRVDASGYQVFVGAGTPGSPSGGVVSIQGVSGGQAVPVSQSGTWTVQQGTPPWAVKGTDADGASPTENPVLVAGYDGTNVQTELTDTSGRQRVVGAASDGAAVTGDPVLVGGQDGTNAQSLLTDTSGRPRIVGAGPEDSAKAGDPVRVAGSDGTNTRDLLTDSGGRQVAVGAAADGATPVGNPVLLAGWDGTNVETLKTNSSGRAEEVLYDGSGNPVGVVLDGALYRLQVDGKVAKGASDLVHLDAIDTDTGTGRLKATLYSQYGDPVALPSVSSSIKNDFVKYSGSDSLMVDGSVTPVVFTYPADSTYDISIQEVKFTMVSNTITFGSDYFGAQPGPLTNGVLIEAVISTGAVTLYNLRQNESFVNFASPGGFEWVVSSKDMVTSDYLIGGGLLLRHGTSDVIRVTVRDKLTGPVAAAVYFKCYVKGNLLEGA